MYKLLLITDRDDIRQAFDEIDNWGQLMFRPITIISDVQEALNFMNKNVVDALSYSLKYTDASPVQQYINEHPSLPIFQTHHKGEALVGELNRIRHFLDQMHRDDGDSTYDEAFVFQLLRDELMNQLLKGGITTEEELVARVKLVRANASLTMQCYLFDFDMPQGEIYLSDRWHYGAERLQNSLRNNFFGKYMGDVYYDVVVLSQRHVRVFACPDFNTELTESEIREQVMQRVGTVVEDIKDYLDLVLNLESVTELNSIMDLVNKQ